MCRPIPGANSLIRATNALSILNFLLVPLIQVVSPQTIKYVIEMSATVCSP